MKMVYTDNIHLIASTTEELHAFAKKIGLSQNWFQHHDRHPHYDLFGRKKKKAIEMGAMLVSKREIVLICQANYPEKFNPQYKQKQLS